MLQYKFQFPGGIARSLSCLKTKSTEQPTPYRALQRSYWIHTQQTRHEISLLSKVLRHFFTGNTMNAVVIQQAVINYQAALNSCNRVVHETPIWYTPNEYRHPHVNYLIDRAGDNRGFPYYYVAQVTCWEFDPTMQMPSGIVHGGNDKYQYSLDRNIFKRPRSYRMTFVEDPLFFDDEMTVSHLCHNNKCHNPQHLVFERLPVNKGRNGCPGGPWCRHRTHCMLPGPYCDQ